MSTQPIAERAYLIWENMDRPEGRALEHWLRAEAELAGGGSSAKTDALGHASPSGPRQEDLIRSRGPPELRLLLPDS
jgi:hypothetical protein